MSVTVFSQMNFQIISTRSHLYTEKSEGPKLHVQNEYHNTLLLCGMRLELIKTLIPFPAQLELMGNSTEILAFDWCFECCKSVLYLGVI